jgi:hypothetical protein
VETYLAWKPCIQTQFIRIDKQRPALLSLIMQAVIKRLAVKQIFRMSAYLVPAFGKSLYGLEWEPTESQEVLIHGVNYLPTVI